MYVIINIVSKPWLWYQGMVGRKFKVSPSLMGYRVEEWPYKDEVILCRDAIVVDAQEGAEGAFKRRVM